MHEIIEEGWGGAREDMQVAGSCMRSLYINDDGFHLFAGRRFESEDKISFGGEDCSGLVGWVASLIIS